MGVMGIDGVVRKQDAGLPKASEREVSFPNQTSLQQIMMRIYGWSVGMCLSTTATAAGLSRHAVVDWFNFLREECSAKLLRMPVVDQMLGGPGLIVEIDESLMIKRKYNRGRGATPPVGVRII